MTTFKYKRSRHFVNYLFSFPFSVTKVQINATPVTDFNELNNAFPQLQKGGRFAPQNCKSRQKMAVVFPYRDRERNLFLVLNNLIPFLMAQNIEFQVFIVEQVRA